MDDVELTLGPWKIVMGTNCILSPEGFVTLNSAKVSIHGVEVPNLAKVDVQFDGLSIGEMAQPFRKEKQDLVMVLSVKLKPDDPHPMPQTELKDHVVDELMKRCLRLEEENAGLRLELEIELAKKTKRKANTKKGS